MKKRNRLRIGIYSPYLHILGGGERYLLSIAEILSQNHDVFLFSEDFLKEKARDFFDISLEKVHFLSNKVIRTKDSFKKYLSLHNFDIFFFMTDGSLFFPLSSKNILIIQSPVHIPDCSFANKVKLHNWQIICYSKFMQKIISQKLKRKAEILSPYIDLEKFACNLLKKEKIILTAGRFFPYPHNKKHSLLIKIFQENYEKYFKDWKLIIVGGLTEKDGHEVLKDVKAQIGNYPIEVHVNVSFGALVKLYKKAKLYWHAAGFGEDIVSHPEKAEHFGITTLEAMAAGAVPVVFNAGGQQDILSEGINGYLWDNKKQLLDKSLILIKDQILLRKFSQQAVLRVHDYSYFKFHEKLKKIIFG